MKNSTVKNRTILFACICITAAIIFCGCGTDSTSPSGGSSSSPDPACSSSEAAAASENAADSSSSENFELPDLTGQTLIICCNSAYKNAVSEITASFESATHAKAELILGSDQQLTRYIQQNEGCDILIPGSVSGYSTLSTLDYIESMTPLLQRIPVIAVPAGNPYGVQSIEDLGHDDLIFGFCNPGTTQIGKTARKILTDKNIGFDSDNIIIFPRESDLAAALADRSVHGGILWNSDADAAWDVDKVSFPEAGDYIEEIPVIRLAVSINTGSCAAFIDYLQRSDIKAVWEKYYFSTAAPAI